MMRLLNAQTFTFDNFPENRLPPYGILSHTWGDSEVSYQAFHDPESTRKDGYAKVKNCCEQALKRGLPYV